MLFQSLLLLYLSVSLSSQYSDALSPSDCEAPKFDHGKTRSRMRGKMVKFICYPNYALVGNRYATCVDGQWDEPIPVCVKPGCKVPTLENGIILRMRQEAWLSFFCIPGFVLRGSPAIYCDGRQWNGTTPYCQDGAPPKLSCDFESEDLCNWRNDELHDFDWLRQNRNTPSSFMSTGPSYDHTLGEGKIGHYMYVESTSREVNDTARLLSPIYNASLAVDGCFSFFYHMWGTSMGGLRVYQKPDKLPLTTLLGYSEDEKRPYMLFEKWNNQGNVWYQSVTPLIDYSDDFQIIIEGIRGLSFVSDIAIDDVAILQGAQCSRSRQAAITPPDFLYDSCADSCGSGRRVRHHMERHCVCHESCLDNNSCCSDFLELCVFSNDTSTTSKSYDSSQAPNNNSAADNQPQTQKLVGTTPATTTNAATTKPTTPPTTVPTTTSTAAPTTTPKPTTTAAKTTTKSSTSVGTTTKKIPRIIFKTTTPVYNATGILVKDKNTTVNKMTTKPKLLTTTVRTTTIQHGVSRTFENHDHYHEIVEEAKKRQQEQINVQKPKIVGKPEVPSSGGKSFLILLAVAVCISGMACVVWGSRTARGRAVVARLRGRATHDPEVRFLTQNADDE